ncbi:Methionyl-tRNA formyltransferase (Fmt) (PDB:1FMT) [Commensalibacter communis]|uniref:glucosamine inositolphosphorylceramide transferase family protein n=1 Tax=Commensalibacter communis TaxID=2972786 RepID=UPI0022FF5E9D|nr:formyl transferase [Commensalibacter communis]CAI3937634.1 Methionyl-tRNA formyltransferase (Fmt) (PDB:1FMT) [Commensalibacter communis]
MSIYETDIWRVGIIKAPMETVIYEGINHIHWLREEPTFQFLADPFGLHQDGKFYIFAESYDYRDRHGRIEVLILDEALRLLDRALVLEEPWHLSYPMMIKGQGQIYMLPEAYKSGKTTLYKAKRFPYQWEPVSEFTFPEVAIDPSIFFHNGLWWMFYTPANSGYSRQSVLSIAFSENLMGPWQTHPQNPVRITPSSSRPGGNVVVTDSEILLPTQDCTMTYGGGLSFLKITCLTPYKFEAHIVKRLKADNVNFGSYSHGIHTFSALGNYTLIDAKKMDQSLFQRLKIDTLYHVRKKMDVFI